MNLLFDVKYHPDGSVDKYKVRCVQAGHRGHLVPGVHFHNTSAASPQMLSTRLCQALRVLKGWTSCPFDICTAYLHAETREDEKYPIRYPEGMREYDEHGNELYGVLGSRNVGSAFTLWKSWRPFFPPQPFFSPQTAPNPSEVRDLLSEGLSLARA